MSTLYLFCLSLCFCVLSSAAQKQMPAQQQGNGHFWAKGKSVSTQQNSFKKSIATKESHVNELTESEDEDNSDFGRQYCTDLSAFYHLFTLNIDHSMGKPALPCCAHLSYAATSKYIVQRVIKV